MKSEKWIYVVSHVSGLYVGEEAEQQNHWNLYALPENALHFESEREAESFIKHRQPWLQEFLSVEKVYTECTQ